MKIKKEPISGQYGKFKIDGFDYRIYWEEAGQGIPLVCLHTAGSDGRQYRACLLYTSPSPRDYAASRMPSSA